jgi:hypothetical protein
MVVTPIGGPREDARESQTGRTRSGQQFQRVGEIDPEIVRDLIKGAINAIDTYPLPRKIIISRIRIVRVQNQGFVIRCSVRQQ